MYNTSFKLTYSLQYFCISMRPLNFLSFTPTFYSLSPSLIVLSFPSSHSYVDSRAIPFFINWCTLKSHINSIQPHVYMHFDYGGIFGRRVWRRAEKQGGRNIVYCRRERTASENPRQMCACCNFPWWLGATVEKKTYCALVDFFRLRSRYSSRGWPSLFNHALRERIIKLFRIRLIDFGETDKLMS